MSTVENIEKNKVKITFSVDAQTFEKGMDYSYNKNKGSINIQGFRRGKAPRKLIEAQYGKAIFYEDAVNFVLPDAYEKAVEENNLDIVSQPEIDIESMNDDGVVFTAEVWIKPEVKLGEYKGLEYTKKDPNPTDEDIDAKLKEDQEKSAREINVTDRPVALGDTANIDFKGYIDDAAFEGGEGKGFDLEIGSHSFIDTFEDQLIGSNIGDSVTVNVTFPENYTQEDLSGKPARFDVKINSIKTRELPEIDDEFVQDTTEFDTLEEYRNDICGRLLAENIKRIDSEKEEELVGKFVESCEIDIPDVMIEDEIEQKIAEQRYSLERMGMTLDAYLNYMGRTLEDLREAYRPVSEKQVRARLALDALAKTENFEVTDEELDKEVQTVAQSGNTDADKIMENENLVEMIKGDVLRQKAVSFIKDAAVEAK